MPSKPSNKRLNRKSYLLNMLFALPIIIFGRAVGNDMGGYNIGGLAMVVTLIIAVFVVIWTVRRLHDLNKSGWLALLLLPPFTIALLPYTLFVPSHDENNKWGEGYPGLSFYGIRTRGAGRIIGAVLLGIAVAYFAILFASFALMQPK